MLAAGSITAIDASWLFQAGRAHLSRVVVLEPTGRKPLPDIGVMIKTIFKAYFVHYYDCIAMKSPVHAEAGLGDESPAGSTRDPIVAALQNSELYRSYRQAFERAFGWPLELQSVGSAHSFATSLRENVFRAQLTHGNHSCAASLQFQQRLPNIAEHQAMSECAVGIGESTVPVRVGDRLVALLRTGGGRVGTSSCRRPVESIQRSGEDATYGGDEAFCEARAITEEQHDAMLMLLEIFALHLGMLANRLLIERSQVEPPVVTKAMAFIEKHLGEQIRLRDVARAANTSAFYFCKLFRRVTGLTYTQYLARVRVEVVKQQLLNPNMRVCEAAFAAGFQSLGQFNRVFRSVAGETPSAYRGRLSRVAGREGSERGGEAGRSAAHKKLQPAR